MPYKAVSDLEAGDRIQHLGQDRLIVRVRELTPRGMPRHLHPMFTRIELVFEGDETKLFFADHQVSMSEASVEEKLDPCDGRLLALVPILGAEARRRLLQLEEAPVAAAPVDKPLSEAGLSMTYRVMREVEKDDGTTEREAAERTELTSLGWDATRVLRKQRHEQ